MDEGNNQASATKRRSFNLEEKLQSKKYNSDFAIEMKGKGNELLQTIRLLHKTRQYSILHSVKVKIVYSISFTHCPVDDLQHFAHSKELDSWTDKNKWHCSCLANWQQKHVS